MADRNVIALDGAQLYESLLRVDDVTGQVTVPTTTPVNPDHLASKAYVDGQVSGTVSTATLSAALAQKASATDLLAVKSGSVQKTGDTMTGKLVHPLPPTADADVANKGYVDSALSGAGFVPKSGATMSGPLILDANPVSGDPNRLAATKRYVDDAAAAAVPRAGATMTGPLILSEHPTNVSNMFQAATRRFVEQWVDAVMSAVTASVAAGTTDLIYRGSFTPAAGAEYPPGAAAEDVYRLPASYAWTGGALAGQSVIANDMIWRDGATWKILRTGGGRLRIDPAFLA